MNADEYYGEYLKGEDLKKDITVTIESVGPETVGEEEKLVVRFTEVKKALVLNATNKDRLKGLFGTPETDEWLGKPVTLTTEMTEFKGKTKPAIRIKVGASAPAQSGRLVNGGLGRPV